MLLYFIMSQQSFCSFNKRLMKSQTTTKRSYFCTIIPFQIKTNVKRSPIFIRKC
uniref:Uncharacterized protein n=1 Tax=Meloidogyne enterolobii TaxID=390850 RepID=A0A6V7V852_MELEN|nr:unnamed protein product [Meloidogyne enterolobii]